MYTKLVSAEADSMISKDIACKAMIRKLKDEVYFRVRIDEGQIEKAKIGGLTGYDVNLPMMIDKSSLDIITDSDNKVLTAYDVARYVYERAKNIEIFRNMHAGFFDMFETIEQSSNREYNSDDGER